jgi:RNA polymerase subunit RPABC4/transcription elongation factor Spt4
MFCRKCGNTIPDDSKFCPYCGETVQAGPADIPGVETAAYGRCENCGRPLEPDDGTLCKDCVAKMVEPYAPTPERKRHSMSKGTTIFLSILVVGVAATMIIAGSITPSAAANELDVADSESVSSAPLSVRQQTILDDFNKVIRGNVESEIKDKLKHPETAKFDYDMTKLSANNAVFTCLGNVSYTNAQGKTSKDDFTVSLIATDKAYYPLYVKLGNTVSVDARKGTNSLGIATASGKEIFGEDEGDSIFKESDGDMIIITDPENIKISLTEFSKIKSGMDYAQVTDIIGSFGKEQARSSIAGYETVIIQWDGNGATGANASVTFQNGKVVAKAQAGLQ